MAVTINQPTANPTRKLSAAVVAAAFMGVLGLVLKNEFPQWYDSDVLMALLPVVVYFAGWIIKDEPNVVIVQP